MSIFDSSDSYRPFKYPWAVEAEKKQRVDMHWTEQQVDLSDDIRQYNSPGGMATDNVSHQDNKAGLAKVLPLFTEMDAAVGEGYAKLLPHVGNNEIRMLLMTQAAREITHARGYAMANEAFGFSESSWESFRSYKELSNKVDLLRRNHGDLSVKLNWCMLLAQTLLGEGIALFGSFTYLLNFKRHGLLMGFNDVNQWSLADEDEHVRNNIRILHEAAKDLTEEERSELDNFIFLCADELVNAEM